MKRPDRSQLNALMRSPAAMARFQATGQLPSPRPAPDSPLIRLLESIPPRDRLQVIGLAVGPALGYTGARRFHNAEQALNWCKPLHSSTHVSAESWRDKRFSTTLYLDDLLACATRYPETLPERLARLLSPGARAALRERQDLTPAEFPPDTPEPR